MPEAAAVLLLMPAAAEVAVAAAKVAVAMVAGLECSVAEVAGAQPSRGVVGVAVAVASSSAEGVEIHLPAEDLTFEAARMCGCVPELMSASGGAATVGAIVIGTAAHASACTSQGGVAGATATIGAGA